MNIKIGVWIEHNGERTEYAMTPEAQRDLLMQLGVQSMKDIAPAKLKKRGLVPVDPIANKKTPEGV